jgi:hypothetical protein
MKITRARTFGIAATLLVFASAPASATPPLKCGKSQTLVRIEDKECPARPRRPAFIVQRACCKNPAGITHCEHMPHCPAISPS